MPSNPDRVRSDFARLRTLFCVFFKISAVTVGGGITMIPVMEREFLEKRAWLTKEDMLDTVAFVQSMPGIIAVNMAIMIGYRTAKLPGAFVSAFAVVLPPFFAILAVAYCFNSLSDSETVSNIFRGVRAAVCALILLSVVKLGKSALKHGFSIAVALSAFVIFVFFPQVNAIWVIVLAGLAGLLLPLKITHASEAEKK